jgi:excisionase family DNA binding protein
MINYEALLLKYLLRINEAAILLDVTPRTVRRYIEQGKIEYKLTPGGTVH